MAFSQTKALEFSVIIPSYQSAHCLLDCLASLEAQNTEMLYEIIVVDSTETSLRTLVVEKYPGVVFIQLSQRCFPGAARNLGVKQARGEWLAFTDADCVAHPDWLENLAYHVRNNKAGIIGGAIINGLKQDYIATAEYYLEFSQFIAGRPAGTLEFQPTCNMAISKQVFEELGGFSALETAEDVEFGSRARANNIHVGFFPEVRITHFNRRSISLLLKKQFTLGRGSAEARQEYELRGTWMVRRPYLSWLVFPARLIGPFRYTGRYNWRQLPRVLFTFPVIFVGVTAYSAGFLSQLRQKSETQA